MTSITTKRLELIQLTPDVDAPRVLEYFKRNQQFLEPWEPKRDNSFWTLETQRELLINDINNINSGQLVKYWMTSKEQPERIIGSVSLSNIVRGVFLSCHLGYRLDAAQEGRGYMREALEAIIDIAFRKLYLHRIEANIIPANTASIRVVEKLGFQPEGLARRYLKINGKWEDHIHMVLLNEELE